METEAEEVIAELKLSETASASTATLYLSGTSIKKVARCLKGDPTFHLIYEKFCDKAAMRYAEGTATIYLYKYLYQNQKTTYISCGWADIYLHYLHHIRTA